MSQVKEKPFTEPMPAALEYLIRNMLDQSVDHWKRQGYYDRLNSVYSELSKAMLAFQQEGKQRRK